VLSTDAEGCQPPGFFAGITRKVLLPSAGWFDQQRNQQSSCLQRPPRVQAGPCTSPHRRPLFGLFRRQPVFQPARLPAIRAQHGRLISGARGRDGRNYDDPEQVFFWCETSAARFPDQGPSPPSSDPRAHRKATDSPAQRVKPVHDCPHPETVRGHGGPSQLTAPARPRGFRRISTFFHSLNGRRLFVQRGPGAFPFQGFAGPWVAHSQPFAQSHCRGAVASNGRELSLPTNLKSSIFARVRCGWPPG